MKRSLSSILVIFFCAVRAIAQCPAGQVEVSIDIKTDYYANEGYWELIPAGNNCGTGTLFSGGNQLVGCNGGSQQNSPSGGYPNSSTVHEGPWCLTEGSDYEILYIDDYGDGGFKFNISINGYPVYPSLTGNGSNSGTRLAFTASAPPAYDLSAEKLKLPVYVAMGNNTIKSKFLNRGTDTLNSVDLYYMIDNNAPVLSTLSGLHLQPFIPAVLSHTVPWQALSAGLHDVKMWAENLNGNQDMNTSNDTAYAQVTVGPGIPNILDDYLNSNPVFTLIGSSVNGLSVPRDLDFHPILTRYEVWVVNKSTESSGGETVKFTNAGQAGQTSILQQDGNAWHFMSLPTGIAFSDNENFATSPGVYDANHNGGAPFTGPTLWSSDPLIYAQPSGGNGSHIDMLHQSPYCMGICHEEDNVFWVFEADSGDVVRYDFEQDHGPGNDDHSDGIVRRYKGLNLVAESTYHVPSHLVLDKNTSLLYIVDTGNERILRMDINSGTFAGNLTPYEPLAEYSRYTGATWDVYIDSGLITPSGIDLLENRLIVSDFASGDIIIYNTSGSGGVEMGRIITGTPGIMGIKIGPDGKIWYVNANTSELIRIDMLSTGIEADGNKPLMHAYPVPATGSLNLSLNMPVHGPAGINIFNAEGKLVEKYSVLTGGKVLHLDIDKLTPGIYAIRLEDTSHSFSTRFIKQ